MKSSRATQPVYQEYILVNPSKQSCLNFNINASSSYSLISDFFKSRMTCQQLLLVLLQLMGCFGPLLKSHTEGGQRLIRRLSFNNELKAFWEVFCKSKCCCQRLQTVLKHQLFQQSIQNILATKLQPFQSQYLRKSLQKLKIKRQRQEDALSSIQKGSCAYSVREKIPLQVSLCSFSKSDQYKRHKSGLYKRQAGAALRMLDVLIGFQKDRVMLEKQSQSLQILNETIQTDQKQVRNLLMALNVNLDVLQKKVKAQFQSQNERNPFATIIPNKFNQTQQYTIKEIAIFLEQYAFVFMRLRLGRENIAHFNFQRFCQQMAEQSIQSTVFIKLGQPREEADLFYDQIISVFIQQSKEQPQQRSLWWILHKIEARYC